MLRWISIVVLIVSVGALGGPTVTSAALGDSAADLVYTPVPQCTVVNTTLSAGGPITPGFPQNFVVNGTVGFENQGGTPGGCGVPIAATAAVLNLVAVNAQGAGDFRIWPFGQAEPAIGFIYFDAAVGLNLANGAVVPLCDPATAACTSAISIDADMSVSDLRVDVTGYLRSTAPRQASVGKANTFLGVNAGNFTMAGGFNTVTGGSALQSNTSGGNNTATGAAALQLNTTGNNNTATGVGTLLSNSTGSSNAATGVNALHNNTTGFNNTAMGAGALGNNTTAPGNTAVGFQALLSNTSGDSNTATGFQALFANTTGFSNTALGDAALDSTTTGNDNTATGVLALASNTTGSGNIAVGAVAGYFTTGNNNIDIGNAGVAGESGVIRIGTAGTHTKAYLQGPLGYLVQNPGTVYIEASGPNVGRLGVGIASSRQVKEDIQDLASASDRLLRLRPVTFRYRTALADGSKPLRYGLVAEEVAQVFPELVIFSPGDEPAGVRYELLSVLLLAELQRQHRELEELRAQINARTAPHFAATGMPAAGGSEAVERVGPRGAKVDQRQSGRPTAR